MLMQFLPDLLLGEFRQPAHAHPCLHILKLPSEHLGLPGTGAGMLHNLPQRSNQDTEEDHACQHHHCCHTLHHTRTNWHRDETVACAMLSFPSGYRRRPRLPVSSRWPHTAPHEIKFEIGTALLLAWDKIWLLNVECKHAAQSPPRTHSRC